MPFPTGQVTVTVTAYWIDRGCIAANGRLSRERNCPVAHAVGAAGFDNPKVSSCTFSAGPDTTFLSSKGERRRYKLPLAAEQFIRRFDNNEWVEPIAFTVDADDYTREFYG